VYIISKCIFKMKNLFRFCVPPWQVPWPGARWGASDCPRARSWGSCTQWSVAVRIENYSLRIRILTSNIRNFGSRFYFEFGIQMMKKGVAILGVLHTEVSSVPDSKLFITIRIRILFRIFIYLRPKTELTLQFHWFSAICVFVYDEPSNFLKH